MGVRSKKERREKLKTRKKKGRVEGDKGTGGRAWERGKRVREGTERRNKKYALSAQRTGSICYEFNGHRFSGTDRTRIENRLEKEWKGGYESFPDSFSSIGFPLGSIRRVASRYFHSGATGKHVLPWKMESSTRLAHTFAGNPANIAAILSISR